MLRISHAQSRLNDTTFICFASNFGLHDSTTETTQQQWPPKKISEIPVQLVQLALAASWCFLSQACSNWINETTASQWASWSTGDRENPNLGAMFGDWCLGLATPILIIIIIIIIGFWRSIMLKHHGSPAGFFLQHWGGTWNEWTSWFPCLGWKVLEVWGHKSCTWKHGHVTWPCVYRIRTVF